MNTHALRTVSIRWSSDTGEYVVKLDGSRPSSLFADSPTDAIDTADALAEELRRDGYSAIDITVCETTRRRALKASNAIMRHRGARRFRYTGEPTMAKLIEDRA